MAVFVFNECQYLIFIHYRYCFVKTREPMSVYVRVLFKPESQNDIILNGTIMWTFYSPVARYFNNFRFWHTDQRWIYVCVKPYINHFEQQKKHKLKIASREDAYSEYFVWRSFVAIKKTTENFSGRKIRCIQWNKMWWKKYDSPGNLLKIQPYNYAT